MEIATIRIQKRQQTGTKKVRRLRDENKVPAVLYGAGKESLPIVIDHDELNRHLRHHLRIYKLDLAGTTQGCYLKEVQWDTLTDEPLHVDFQRIDLTKPIEVEVELLYVGHPKGIAHGGRFIKDLHTIKLRSLPAAIPEDLELKVEHLDLHGRVLAEELELPSDCTLAVSPDTQVCHVTGEIKVVEIEEAPVEGAEGEERAEGAEGEAKPEGAEAKPEGDKPSGG
ncbi:MAG: 50S ribosomal protein L25 [Planctomycetota bacterium]|jgi:large subunit ribosomal protein L25